jgi:hypothetical protein
VPFTPAHIAAVLPLRRSPLPFAALACGAVAPDLPYYLVAFDQPLRGAHTHSLRGTLVSVPIAVLFWLALRVSARPVGDLAPESWRGRLRTVATPAWTWTVVPAAWVGAVTHVAWDHWTHSYGWPVRHLAALRVETPLGLQVHEVLQQLSTLFGLSVLAVVLTRWHRRTPPAEPSSGVPARWRLLVLAAGVAVAAAVSVWLAHDEEGTRRALTRAVEGVVFGVLVVTAVYVVGWHVARARSRQRSRRAPG